jgi:cytochrome c oxidase subunit 4
MEQPSLSVKSYVLAFCALLGLLGLNLGQAFIPLGWGNMFLSVTIAAIQAGVIALVLMHGLFDKVLIRLIMAGALVWFLILVTLTMTDYITRGWVPVAGK